MTNWRCINQRLKRSRSFDSSSATSGCENIQLLIVGGFQVILWSMEITISTNRLFLTTIAQKQGSDMSHKKDLLRRASNSVFMFHVLWGGRFVPLLHYRVTNTTTFLVSGPFLEALEMFRTRKAAAKSQTLRLQSCFSHIFLI